MLNRSWLRLLALVMVFGLVAAACGSDSSDDDSAGGDDDTAQTDEGGDGGDGGSDDDSAGGDDGATEVTVPPETDDPVPGGTLRYGLIAEVDGLNPTTSALAPSGRLMGLAVFDSLVAFDSDGGWMPKLAESFTPNDDFTVWTMTLRPGVTFHDGTPLNAEAVVTNFEAQRADPLVGNAILPYYDADTPIEAIDELTVQYNLTFANSEWPTSLATAGQLGMMASPAWLEAAEADETLNQQPVGAGPFVFESRSQDATTRFVRNDEYYGGDVWLDAIEYFPITDGAQRADQLVGGAIDALMTTDSPSSQQLVDEEESGGPIRNILDDTGEEAFVMMNTSAPPFDDIRVRQALTFSTPRQAYNTRIAEDINRLADQMFTPDSPFYNPDVVQEADDPDRAAPLVAEYCAEFPDNCSDGKVNIEYMFSGPSAQQTRIADLLTEGWSEHFNVSVVEVLQDDLVLNAALGAYQVNTWRQFGNPNPYNDRLWMACETVGPISLNWPRLCDEARTELLNSGGAATDEATRIENMQQVVQNVNEAYTYVFLNHTRWDNAFNEAVRGICDATTPEGGVIRCTDGGVHFSEQLWLAG
ncbi:MAG: ABC transporter substrate-binding protein [Acidimicrobiia bacterium]|nr:ABC transporter substrate-binding protein [Acidimicrobiia bacterium]